MHKALLLCIFELYKVQHFCLSKLPRGQRSQMGRYLKCDLMFAKFEGVMLLYQPSFSVWLSLKTFTKTEVL